MRLNANLLDTTGKRVERLRKDLGLSQAELAALAGVRQNYISAIERDTASPSAEVVARIARTLGASTDFLLLLTDIPAQREMDMAHA